jgi:hypothetical protein
MDKIKLITNLMDETKKKLEETANATLQPEFKTKSFSEKVEQIKKLSNLNGQMHMGNQILRILGGF